MKVLIIKMTSMGDIIHTFPALTDACHHIPDISFDWLVEESFAQMPKWHSKVDTIIPLAFRRWRKTPFKMLLSNEIPKALMYARKTKYDLIIDAQGLLKSSIVAGLLKGKRCGYDKNSAKEVWGTWIYHKKFNIPWEQHAVTRARQLFAAALNYQLPKLMPDYGLSSDLFSESNELQHEYLVFLPNTTWQTKHWPESHWEKLLRLAVNQGYYIRLPWGTAVERDRAEGFARISSQIEVLPKLNLTDVTKVIAGAKAVVAVDTGLSHIAAALNKPTITIYGATDPKLTGTFGNNQEHLSASFACSPCLQRHCKFDNSNPPCYGTITAELVWDKLSQMLVR